MNKIKKIISLVVIVSCLCIPMNVFASDTTNITGNQNTDFSIDVNGTVTSSIITVTVPTNIIFAVNPNNQSMITTVPVQITNLTNIPINIDFIGIKAQADTQTKVVANNKFNNWDSLSVNDTNSNIALGINDGINTYWSPDEQSITKDNSVGSIMLNAKDDMDSNKQIQLVVLCGKAWTASKALSYDMDLRISLK